MKHLIVHLRSILLSTLLLMYLPYNIFSQENDISRGKQPGLFIGLGLGPSQTQLTNKGILSVSELLSVKRNSYFGSMEIGYFFSRYFGLSSGIGFNSYNAQLTLDTYQNEFNTYDSENEAYERLVSGSNITEDQKVDFLNIPVSINIRLPFNNAIGFFLQTGVNLAIPFGKSYKSSGTFTYKGYYPSYNVLLENLPQYGFPSNVIIDSKGELELKSLNFIAIASAGLDFFVMKKIQAVVAVYYDKSLSNISQYPPPDNFQLSSDIDQINSLMEGSSKVTAQSIGLSLSFRYYLY